MPVTVTKVVQIEPVPLFTLTAGQYYVGSVIDVSQMFGAQLYFDVASLNNPVTATPTPPKLEVQISQKASGNDTWLTKLERFPMQFSNASSALSAGATAGDTSFQTIADPWNTAGQLVPRFVFLHDPTFGNSEWVKWLSRSGNVNTIADPLLNNHPITTTIARRGARYVYSLDFTSITRMRIVLANNITRTTAPTDHAVRIALITEDAVTL